jgi:hypothetical protein
LRVVVDGKLLFYKDGNGWSKKWRSWRFREAAEAVAGVKQGRRGEVCNGLHGSMLCYHGIGWGLRIRGIGLLGR